MATITESNNNVICDVLLYFCPAHNLSSGTRSSCSCTTIVKYIFNSLILLISGQLFSRIITDFVLQVGGLHCLLQASRLQNSPYLKNSRTAFIATKLDPTGSTWRHSENVSGDGSRRILDGSVQVGEIPTFPTLPLHFGKGSLQGLE